MELSHFNFVLGRHVISQRMKRKKGGWEEEEKEESYLLVRLCKNILLRGKNRSTGNLYLHTLTRAKIYRTTGCILPVLHVCNFEILFPQRIIRRVIFHVNEQRQRHEGQHHASRTIWQDLSKEKLGIRWESGFVPDKTFNPRIFH